MRILIADAGATKTDWVRLTLGNSSGHELEFHTGIGISPLHNDTDMIEEELRLVRAALGDSFDKIRFFGAGIGSPLIAGKMETILSEMFMCKDIKADSDMSGAAMGLLGSKPGIACIMGTGSNSCHYNGNAIDRKSASLGYLLDDEGGGVAFCRRLLADVFKKVAPKDIIEDFENRYSLSVSDVVTNLYRKPAPNRWISGFMPYIVEHLSHPYINSLVETQIERFFDREFCSYPEAELKEEGIGFAGSVSEVLKDNIVNEMQKRGWKLRSVIGKPLDSLINQYRNNNNEY